MNYHTDTIRGYYGSRHTPTDIYTYTDINGGTWYVCDGSINVNYTYDEVVDGVDIEMLDDSDCFTAGSPIESEEDLIEAIED